MENGMDALTCLLCFGYTIVRGTTGIHSLLGNPDYNLCSESVDWRFKKSIILLLEETNESKDYYTKRLQEEGKKTK